VPAIRRNATGRRLDEWRIATCRTTTVEVFGSCTQGDARLEVHFPAVDLDPQQLRLDDGRRRNWSLRQEDGKPIARAEPRVAHGNLGDHPLACGAAG
jgi:hypothetical protein